MTTLRTTLVAMFVTSAIALVACLEPTQIELTLRTDVPYAPGRTVAISVSKSGTSDSLAPSTTAEDEWDAEGKIGTLVLLPSDQRDEPVSVRVVMGLGRDPSTCTTADAKGCIFARRRLAFVPHEPLALPVTLFAACEGVPCDENSTCTALGQCVSATVDPAACADGKVCEPGAGTASENDASTSSSSSSSSSGESSSSSSSSSGGSSSSSSGESSSSSGTAAQCDPTDVTVAAAGALSFGSIVNNASTDIGATIKILINSPGQSASFARVLSTPNQTCPLHFALDINDLVIDATGTKVGIMTINRNGGGDLALEVLNVDGNAYMVGFKGSAIAYRWTGPAHAARVEAIVPLSPSDPTPLRLRVGVVETVIDDIPPPPVAVTSPTLEFGLTGANSHIDYQQVRYYFAP